jgi:hypothetical protein
MPFTELGGDAFIKDSLSRVSAPGESALTNRLIRASLTLQLSGIQR